MKMDAGWTMQRTPAIETTMTHIQRSDLAFQCAYLLPAKVNLHDILSPKMNQAKMAVGKKIVFQIAVIPEMSAMPREANAARLPRARIMAHTHTRLALCARGSPGSPSLMIMFCTMTPRITFSADEAQPKT